MQSSLLNTTYQISRAIGKDRFSMFKLANLIWSTDQMLKRKDPEIEYEVDTLKENGQHVVCFYLYESHSKPDIEITLEDMENLLNENQISGINVEFTSDYVLKIYII